MWCVIMVAKKATERVLEKIWKRIMQSIFFNTLYQNIQAKLFYERWNFHGRNKCALG